MNKKVLFISYSDANKDKVELIRKEFNDHYLFEPLIVANRRAPNKALIEKVTEGISSAYRVIAILTQDSINTQWINQEIGYATAKGVKLIPIVEKIIMSDLKGFIHKENDLPYAFNTRIGISTRDENKSFMYYFRLLIKDLEEELSPTLSPLRKPLNTYANSGEQCPETGLWRSATSPYIEIKITEGTMVPLFRARIVKWRLISYS